MFKYYEGASVCYAYLEDVHVKIAAGSNAILQRMFCQSRWFTRE